VAVTVEVRGRPARSTSAAGAVTWPGFDLAAGASTARTLVLKVATTSIPVGTQAIVNSVRVTKRRQPWARSQELERHGGGQRNALSVPPELRGSRTRTSPSRPAQAAGGADGQRLRSSCTTNGEQSGTAQVAVYNGPPPHRHGWWGRRGGHPGSPRGGSRKTFQFLAAARPRSDLGDGRSGESGGGGGRGETISAGASWRRVPDLAIGSRQRRAEPGGAAGGGCGGRRRHGCATPARPPPRTSPWRCVRRRAGPRRAADLRGPDPGDPRGRQPDPPLHPGPAAEGQHRLTAVADPDNAILELSETNNQGQRVVTVAPRGGAGSRGEPRRRLGAPAVAAHPRRLRHGCGR